MNEIKEMPFNEKFAAILGYNELLENFALTLVREIKGDEKVAELRSIWLKESETIPESGTYKEKYEVAFSNWLHNWQSAYVFARDQFGEGGAEKFVQAAIDANEKRSSGAALQLYKFIRAFSRKTAFQSFAKQIAYQYQAFTPLSLSSLSGQSAVIEIPHCKVLDVEGCSDFCTVGCQKAFPVMVRDQFNVNAIFKLEGKSCTVTFAPL